MTAMTNNEPNVMTPDKLDIHLLKFQVTVALDVVFVDIVDILLGSVLLVVLIVIVHKPKNLSSEEKQKFK